MAAQLKVKRGPSGNLSSLPVVDGQLLFTTDTKKIYLDNGTTRLQVGGGTVTTGSANGTIAVDGADVAVKGLGARAFDSTSYLPLSGGTLTGSLSVNGSVQAGTMLSSQTSAEATVGVENKTLNSNLYLYANNSRLGLYCTIGSDISKNIISIDSAGVANFIGNASTASSVAWSGITGKPNTFTPSSHTHNYIASLGAVAPQTGRTNAYDGAYTYKTTAGDSSIGAPNTHTAVIGFGNAAAGSAEIAVQWTSGMGVWVRALRDYQDNWYDWCEILTQKSWNNYITLSSLGAAPASHTHDKITNGRDHLLIQRNNRTLLSVRSSETVPSFALEKYSDVNKLQWHVYSDNGEYLRTNVLLDDYNWDDYIPLGSYLPLSGGTITGNLSLSTAASGTSPLEQRISINGVFGSRTVADAPGIGFHTGNVGWATIKCVGSSFHFYDSACTGYVPIYGSQVHGAVWNDYAEYRSQNETIEPGYITYCDDDGKLKKTTERLQKYEGIVSDTFGFAIGETDDCKTPLAVSGRALVYCDPEEEHFHSGDCVCAGPGGLAYRMTREEVMEFPDRIVGVVSEIPTYETWGTGNVAVNGRIWIKVR